MVVESVCQNRLGIHLAWNFFKEHLADFYARYGHGLFLMAKLIKCVTESFSTEEELTEVTEYFAAHSYIGNFSRVVDPDWIRIQRLCGSVLGIRIRIEQKCWIRIRIKSILIHNPEVLSLALSFFKNNFL
jgi:hypothetical protein